MSERSDNIRAWLLRKPRPSLVRVTDTEGETHDVAIPSNPRWRNVAEDIDALEPARVVALSSDDMTLRAERFASSATPAPEPHDPAQDALVPTPLTSDPETLRLTHFANLLYRATSDSVQALADIVKNQETRHKAAEARAEERAETYRREAEESQERVMDLLDAIDDQRQKDGDGADMKETIAKTFFASFADGKRANGKAKPS